jgi:hypothetical protein
LALIFKSDRELSHNDCHLVSYSAFGNKLRVWSEKYWIVDIHLPQYQVWCRKLFATEYKIPSSLLPAPKREVNADFVASGLLPRDEDARECWDREQQPMFNRCVRKYGALQRGECFSLVPWLGVIGIILAGKTEPPLITDVTIYLDDPISSKGGTVVILPYPIAAYIDHHVDPQRQENTILSTTVRDVFSVVRFNYLQSGTFVFRFAPRNPNHPRAGDIQTKLLTIGTSYRYVKSKEVAYDFQALIVSGSEANEDTSRKQEADVYDYLSQGALNCNTFFDEKSDIQVCGLKAE